MKITHRQKAHLPENMNMHMVSMYMVNTNMYMVNTHTVNTNMYMVSM